MKYFFYDIVPTNIIRFYQHYIESIRNSDRNSEFFFGIEHEDGKTFNDVNNHYYFNKDLICTQFKSINWFIDYFKKNKIDVVFINGQRIADDRVIFAAKKLGIKTFMVQHGMYIPFLKRDVKFFTSKVKKALSYLYYTIDISRQYKKDIFLPIKYFKVYVLGENQINAKIDRAFMNVDHVFVYGDYWKNFHVSQFGYQLSEQVTIGTPDLFDLDDIAKKPLDDSICYIAQTLVEDGRLERKKQLKFFKSLVDFSILEGKELIVKMHPRADTSLYENTSDNVKFVFDEFPYCKTYIGHYSTLLAKSMSLNNTRTIIFEYEGHPTPHYFVESSVGTIKSTSELKGVFKKPLLNSSPIESYFNYNPDFSKDFSKLVVEILKSNRLE